MFFMKQGFMSELAGTKPHNFNIEYERMDGTRNKFEVIAASSLELCSLGETIGIWE